MSADLKKLVEDSGMITHYKTMKALEKRLWPFLVSPYYYDHIGENIREMDLIAERQFCSADRPSHSTAQVNMQLFIECKYIKQEIVFLFNKINKSRAVSSLERESELVLADKRSGDILPTDFHYIDNGGLVAKLFSANTNKEDVIYKAISQCLHALLSYRSDIKKPIFHEFNGRSEVNSRIIQYPIIVCDNFEKLTRITFDEQIQFSVEKMDPAFLLEVDYRGDYFLIDVVDINYLATFLDKMEDEAGRIVKALSFRR
ncbi:MAG: hypothetical protein Q8P86_00190 [bacterium]|nr:hypothetical protein [bacterium]